jgi:hypothetical protein
VHVGFNDLATTHPQLVAEWDYERNAPLTPQQTTFGTARKIYWLCPKGHSYKSNLVSRASGNKSCPFCSGHRVLAGFNDLATTHPQLVAEWDYERNAPLTPEQVSIGSNTKVAWLCPEGHEYLSVVNSRNRGRGCPVCAETGYDPSQPGMFYFIKSNSLGARKVGITNHERKFDRIALYGTEWTTLKTYTHIDGQVIRDLETTMLRWLRKDLKMPAYLGKAEMGRAGGFSETFSMEGPSDYEVMQKVEETLTLLLNRRKK